LNRAALFVDFFYLFFKAPPPLTIAETVTPFLRGKLLMVSTLFHFVRARKPFLTLFQFFSGVEALVVQQRDRAPHGLKCLTHRTHVLKLMRVGEAMSVCPLTSWVPFSTEISPFFSTT